MLNILDTLKKIKLANNECLSIVTSVVKVLVFLAQMIRITVVLNCFEGNITTFLVSRCALLKLGIFCCSNHWVICLRNHRFSHIWDACNHLAIHYASNVHNLETMFQLKFFHCYNTVDNKTVHMNHKIEMALKTFWICVLKEILNFKEFLFYSEFLIWEMGEPNVVNIIILPTQFTKKLLVGQKNAPNFLHLTDTTNC